jgi:hypothetical protein
MLDLPDGKWAGKNNSPDVSTYSYKGMKAANVFVKIADMHQKIICRYIYEGIYAFEIK